MGTRKINYIEEHQNIRKKLWMDVYVAFVGAGNSVSDKFASDWADTALSKFDERFEEPIQPPEITTPVSTRPDDAMTC